MGFLIGITLTLSTQNLVAKDVKASYSRKINLTSQKIYKVENEFIKIVKWKYHSDEDVILLYMTENDIFWFNDHLYSYVFSFSERVDKHADHFLSEKGIEGSGFKDLSFSQYDYYLVFVSFGTGELEYEITFYSFYLDYQIVLNTLTVIIVIFGSIYVLIQLNALKHEKKDNKVKRNKIVPNLILHSSIIRYCECGTKLDNDALYCHNCGKKFKYLL